jgi:hypothetical protein
MVVGSEFLNRIPAKSQVLAFLESKSKTLRRKQYSFFDLSS